MSKPSTRTILALAVAAVRVGVAAGAGIGAVAGHNAPEKEPTVTAYAHGKTVEVPPFRFWSIEQGGADGISIVQKPDSRTTASLPAPPGYPVQLSLPDYLVGAPWKIRLEYVAPDGTTQPLRITYLDYEKGTRAVTIPSLLKPDLRLTHLEIQLVVLTQDQLGNQSFMPYQAWSIDTV